MYISLLMVCSLLIVLNLMRYVVSNMVQCAGKVLVALACKCFELLCK